MGTYSLIKNKRLPDRCKRCGEAPFMCLVTRLGHMRVECCNIWEREGRFKKFEKKALTRGFKCVILYIHEQIGRLL